MSEQQTTRVINSASYGSFEVAETQIYHFPRGIVGLGEYKDYALIHIEGAPYYILHELDHDLSFILLPANYALEDYGFRIDQATIDLLGIGKPEDVMTFLIVNIIDEQIYVNLKAPVLLTNVHQRGCQFIIDDMAFPIRYPLSRQEGG